MQLHELKSTTIRKPRKRVGRGGKRGTYSGKGQKGQKSRSGKGISPDFRGGDVPVWKLFPKQRGATKKTKIKHRTFRLSSHKATPLNLKKISILFKDGEKVSPETLFKKKLTKSLRGRVKILGDGVLTKKLEFENVSISMSARKKILSAGSKILS